MSQRIKRLTSDIKDLKTNQTLGGDSWIVYKHEIIYVKGNTTYGTEPVQPVYQIDFTPDEAGAFVAVCHVTTGNRQFTEDDQDIMPDPNYFGRWYDCTTVGSGGSTGNCLIIVYATKKGTLTVSQINKQITA